MNVSNEQLETLRRLYAKRLETAEQYAAAHAALAQRGIDPFTAGNENDPLVRAWEEAENADVDADGDWKDAILEHGPALVEEMARLRIGANLELNQTLPRTA